MTIFIVEDRVTSVESSIAMVEAPSDSLRDLNESLKSHADQFHVL